MSADYTDEHLANITSHLKNVEQVSHQDSVNLYCMLKAQTARLTEMQKSVKRIAEIQLVFFWLYLVPTFVGLVLWLVYSLLR